MYQIDNSTAATTQPASTAAGTPGFFTDGNPATSTAATIVPAEWLNAVMMELVNVVTGAGLTLSKSTFTQVLSAIKRIGQNTIVLADTGAVNAYTATNSTPLVAGTWVDGVVQAVKIAHANTGASTYAPDGLSAIPIYGLGLQPLQGGELALNGTAVLMRTTIATVNGGNPICVLMECAGGTQQIAPATQSQHAAQLGQVIGMRQRFTGNGSFTVPNGVTTIWVSGCAGGGGGAGASGNNGVAQQAGGGGGGGAGQWVLRQPYTVTPGQVITITIGTAGSAGSGGAAGVTSGVNGGSGGSTIVGSLVTLTGGGGGGAGVNNGGSTIGSGGATGSGYPNGSTGDDGYAGAGGGAGASCPFGGGSPRVRGSQGIGISNIVGYGFGAGGGGGGGCYAASAVAGGNGSAGLPGMVLIEW